MSVNIQTGLANSADIDQNDQGLHLMAILSYEALFQEKNMFVQIAKIQISKIYKV